MEELLPIILGVAAGLLATWVGRGRFVIVGFAVVLGGPLATWLSGEAEMTWGFVVVDMGEVFLAAVFPIMFFAHRRSRMGSRGHGAEAPAAISKPR